MTAHTSTLKSLFGFIRSLLARWLPFLRKSNEPGDIYNYLAIDQLFATSGQPGEAQFSLIKEAGYTTVINLAPSSMLENAVIAEADILSSLGLRYVHIPVNFKNPTDEDFQQFVQALEETPAEKVWVHCAANMRVSAFTYKYRREILAEEQSKALADLHKIWEPVGVWKEFIEEKNSKL